MMLDNIKNIGIISWGGLGDVLLMTPALRCIKKQYSKANITVFCDPFHEPILRNNPNIDRLQLSGRGVGKKELRRLFRKMDKVYRTDYAMYRPSMSNSEHATSLIGKILDVTIDNYQIELYLDEYEERMAIELVTSFKFPVTICVNSTHNNKDWPIPKWVGLVNKIKEVDFIQIGEATDVEIKGCIDMRGKTTVREAFSIVKHSRLVIAVDSLWNHVSNAVGTKGIILWGPGNPIVWGYSSNINIYKKNGLFALY